MTQPTDAPRTTWPLLAALGVLMTGLYPALYLTYAKLALKYDVTGTFQSQCNFGATFNCEAAQASAVSEIAGIPIALLAIPMYLAMASLAWVGRGGGPHAGRATAYLAALGSVTVAYAVYLGVYSATELGAWCPYCLWMYGAQLLATVAAFVASRSGVVATLKSAFSGAARLAQPMIPTVAVAVVATIAAYAAYSQQASAMADSVKAGVDAQFATTATETPAAATGAATSPAATPSPAQAAAPEQATRVTVRGPATVTPANKPKAKLTDNGWDYYEIPVGPDDHVFGPADAPVTYVAFKDFECNFCRYVGTQERPLKDKYVDQVRFVFKHYPMNADCNHRMGTTRMHDGACRAARASICAADQDRFWDMHDVLYRNQKKFSDDELTGYATEMGLDMPAYQQCYKSQEPQKRITEDVHLAGKMRISGTPRIYINNRLVTGSSATDVLDYYIQMALKNPIPPASAEARAATAESPRMVKMTKTSGPFWIDAFEASIDKKGNALSAPGVQPAQASWFEAKSACERVGKRMCTEEEWVSACIGEAAVDGNSNGLFVDGPVQGRLYPYGAFYEAGACRDSEDKYTGAPGRTGDNPRCRTEEGVYDLAGNLYEWIGGSESDSAMIGGDWRSATSGTCRRRATTYGPGIKNATTGFRCCADSDVSEVADVRDIVDTTTAEIVGQGIPADLKLDTIDGRTLDPASFEGKVTYLTFFASWCGNCRKQMPAIKAWQEEWGGKGFQVVGINVDRTREKGEKYVARLDPNFIVAYDPSARTMSDFDINAMPTSFIVGRDGLIKRRVVGYKTDEIAQTRAAITSLM